MKNDPDKIETLNDIFHRGTRITCPAVDSNGRLREGRDQLGRELSIDADGSLDITATNGEAPPEPTPAQIAQTEAVQQLREAVGFLAHGKTDPKEVGVLCLSLDFLLIPGTEKRSEFARRLGVSAATITERLKAAQASLALFLRWKTTPSANPAERSV